MKFVITIFNCIIRNYEIIAHWVSILCEYLSEYVGTYTITDMLIINPFSDQFIITVWFTTEFISSSLTRFV